MKKLISPCLTCGESKCDRTCSIFLDMVVGELIEINLSLRRLR